MAEQPSTAATPALPSVLEDELLLVRCLNRKEVVEYKLKLKTLVTDAIKQFQWEEDPKEDDLSPDLVYPTLVSDAKKLVKTVYENVLKANQKEIINTVTDTDRHCIWDLDMMAGNMDDEDNNEDIDIQEEEGVPTPPNWVNIIQSLDMELDAHQIDKIVMLLQCHSEMLEWQAMVSKMLAEVRKSVDRVTFRLILQMVIQPMHQINLPGAFLATPKKAKRTKLSREAKIVCWITPNPDKMTEWSEDSATLYLAATTFYLMEKAVAKASNMKCMAGKFRIHLSGLCRCINGRIYEGGTMAKKCKASTADTTPKKTLKKATK